MCDPVFLGTAATASALPGSAAALTFGVSAGTAATTGLFGTAGAFSAATTFATLTSPGVSLGLQVAGFGIQAMGQQQTNAMIQQQFAYKAAVLKNQQITIEQDKAHERESERVRQQLLSEEGRLRRGEIIVSQAALGQLVNQDSAQDLTDTLASEVAFKKLISQSESENRLRNLEVEAGNVGADIGLTGLEAKTARTANTFNQLSTVLTTGANITRRFRFESGSVAFNT